MNDCKFTGRFVSDPELRQTKSGTYVCNFSLAVQRPGTKKEDGVVDYFDYSVWGSKDGTPGRAGVIHQYFHKGDGIVINKSILTTKTEEKDGVKRKYYTLIVDDFEFPMGMKGGAAQTEQAKPAPEEAKAIAEEALAGADEEGLPF